MLCLGLALAGFSASAAEDPADDTPVVPPTASEQPPRPDYRGTPRRWGINLGAFVTTFDTEVRWDDKTLGPGTVINLEDDLGFEQDVTKSRIDFILRTGRRSLLEATYLRLRRNAVRTLLDSQIQWGDNVYRIGATVEADFDSDIYKISWGYALVQRPRARFGLSAGISTLDLSGSIRGLVEVDGSPGTPAFRAAEAEEFVAPVPVLGAHLAVNLTPRLIFRAYGQLFRYDNNDWEADFLDTLAALEYAAFEHVSFGAGYDYFGIEYRQNRYDLHADYEFRGLTVYMRILY